MSGKYYNWHQEEDRTGTDMYRTPNYVALCKKEDGAWKWCVFNNAGYLVASEYYIASKQNARRDAVIYITKKEKDNG